MRRELSQAASNSNFHLWVCAAPQERGYPLSWGQLPYLFNLNLHKGSYTTPLKELPTKGKLAKLGAPYILPLKREVLRRA